MHGKLKHALDTKAHYSESEQGAITAPWSERGSMIAKIINSF